jgi:hypothetical protein
MKVWWSRDRLTRELAQGAASVESRELALRAGQITAKQTREVVACSIDDLLERVEQPPPPLTAQIPLDRAKIRAVRRELAGLAARLRSSQRVHTRGMALVVLLLTDVERPLYGLGTAEELEHAIIEASERLDAPPEEAW